MGALSNQHSVLVPYGTTTQPSRALAF